MSLSLPSWDLVKSFLTVMRAGSLSAAARKLGVSQPTVRRDIESLEASLGATLFTRAATGLLPTASATSILASAERAEAAMAALQRDASSPTSTESGTVRITCSEIFGVEVLPPILAQLAEAYPSLVTELVLSNHPDDLLQRKADVAVRLVNPSQQLLLVKKVRPIAIGLFASPSYVARHALPTSREALWAQGHFIGDDKRTQLAEGYASLGLPLPSQIIFKADSDVAQLAAIKNGIGIGPVQVTLAEAAGLVRIQPQMSLTLDCWIVMHEDLKPMRRVKLVFDFLAKALGK
jgi:DNA-binding transcriptional LysR family regulator